MEWGNGSAALGYLGEFSRNSPFLCFISAVPKPIKALVLRQHKFSFEIKAEGNIPCPPGSGIHEELPKNPKIFPEPARENKAVGVGLACRGGRRNAEVICC